ncbi:MAG: SDR family NAD(P)-dependent oxidoreductase, partial [Solirubrobacteraceae bacterium]
MPSAQQPERTPATRRRGPAQRARAVALDLADGAIRQGLKRPLLSPGRIARRVLGSDRLVDAVAGRVVVVTGASSGIGEAAAHRFAAAGAIVVLVARREEELARVTASIRGNGGQARPYTCDLSDRDAIDGLVAQLLAEYG